jgi:hypothetical protein
MLTGPNYVLLDGYRGIVIEGHGAKSTVGCSSGNYITLHGRVSHADGSIGEFRAQLVEEGPEWALMNVYVTMPPAEADGGQWSRPIFRCRTILVDGLQRPSFFEIFDRPRSRACWPSKRCERSFVV